MKNERVRIGSRGSELALWQARWVQNELTKRFPKINVTIHIIKTTGDKILDSPLSKIGSKALFTKEIERALLANEIDLAVHSLKDLPTELPDGLTIGAICKRDDMRDVFIPHPSNPKRKLLEQAQGAKIATGSLRRKCQLLHLRPDFEIIDVRGNLNTRLKKLDASDWAGMILARAGLVRLQWENRIGETFEPDVMLPAVGQGALAIEVRTDDDRISEVIAELHHTPTAQAAMAERSLLRRLEGGCQVPIGTYGRIKSNENEEPTLLLDALIGSLDGQTVMRGKSHGRPKDAVSIGEHLAEILLASGAEKILRQIRGTGPKKVVDQIEV